ncbi:hypothetical protein [Metaclostridioides mangenotii]|uniref:hypothetical protein n=1 Tax=Metaclostridioides mangenotii TaxID=1540 RepID=UPI000464BA64|nr:hypothetical protein [Clostridioides mangenotii]
MKIIREKDKKKKSIEQICNESIMPKLYSIDNNSFVLWEGRETFISSLIESVENNKLMYLYGKWHRGIGKSSFIANLSKEYDIPIITTSRMQKKLFVNELHVPENKVFFMHNEEYSNDTKYRRNEFNKFADNENRMYALVDLWGAQGGHFKMINKYFDENDIKGTLLGFVSDDVQYRLK